MATGGCLCYKDIWYLFFIFTHQGLKELFLSNFRVKFTRCSLPLAVQIRWYFCDIFITYCSQFSDYLLRFFCNLNSHIYIIPVKSQLFYYYTATFEICDQQALLYILCSPVYSYTLKQTKMQEILQRWSRHTSMCMHE